MTIPSNSEKINYFDDFVLPQIEMNCVYKNYKVTKISIKAEKEFTYRIDDQPEDSSKIHF